ncbi:MAG: LON peptidase substrate-binding domain-containing protein [Kiloniellales bacterium]|nr:LON peptidase substrate-binding domain-containing protein [Kiloniellales bacterium]
MTQHPFDLAFEELPSALPVFPLPGALLLPRGHLPLNIFEPRYLCMIQDALAGSRLIGMIQPREGADDPGGAPIYGVGCAGQIAAFNETDDGRYLITLRGLLRFSVARELKTCKGYRQVEPGFETYRGDLEEETVELDRERLLTALRAFFAERELSVDWKAVARLDGETLVNTMAMLCPFEPPEKQALLEAKTLAARAETLFAVLEMSKVESGEDLVRH